MCVPDLTCILEIIYEVLNTIVYSSRCHELLGFVCPGLYLTLTVEPVLLSVISAGDASHVLGGESPGAARGHVVGSCHGDFSR